MTFTAQELLMGLAFVAVVAVLVVYLYTYRNQFLAADFSLLDDVTARLIQIGIALSIAAIIVAAIITALFPAWAVKINGLGAQELLYLAGAFWLVQHATIRKG
jgi:purine-cytosine permease-like protein